MLFRNVNTFEEYEDLVQKEDALRVRGNAE